MTRTIQKQKQIVEDIILAIPIERELMPQILFTDENKEKTQKANESIKLYMFKQKLSKWTWKIKHYTIANILCEYSGL